MLSFQLRFAYLVHPKVLIPTVILAAAGYLAIVGFGQNQVSSFHFTSPFLAPIEATFHEILAERYAGIALSWVTGTIGIAWLYAGKQAKKAVRIIERF